MNYKIISDSSSDITALEGVDYASVPLKIITDEKEYIDDSSLNVDDMISDLKRYSGISKSSCPNIEEWKSEFKGSQNIFCVTITRNLSGSFNSAGLALQEYLQENPESRGCVLDTLTVGPENALIIEKLRDLIASKLAFSEIKQKIEEYKNKTHLIFCLDSLRNLANNGRVGSATAKIAGILGIRIIGKASSEGTLEITNKARGAGKALSDILSNMLKNGYNGGSVRIHHCRNLESAKQLGEMIKEKFRNASIVISETRALCSFYAEAGGLLIGYEGVQKT